VTDDQQNAENVQLKQPVIQADTKIFVIVSAILPNL